MNTQKIYWFTMTTEQTEEQLLKLTPKERETLANAIAVLQSYNLSFDRIDLIKWIIGKL